MSSVPVVTVRESNYTPRHGVCDISDTSGPPIHAGLAPAGIGVSARMQQIRLHTLPGAPMTRPGTPVYSPGLVGMERGAPACSEPRSWTSISPLTHGPRASRGPCWQGLVGAQTVS